jgi:hypothetical protein
MDSTETWADVDACTLPTAERPLRVAELDDLLSSVTAVQRPAPTLLRIDLAGHDELLETARDLAARETACCSFFTFTVTRSPNGVRMDIAVPDARVDILDALAERAS